MSGREPSLTYYVIALVVLASLYFVWARQETHLEDVYRIKTVGIEGYENVMFEGVVNFDHCPSITVDAKSPLPDSVVITSILLSVDGRTSDIVICAKDTESPCKTKRAKHVVRVYGTSHPTQLCNALKQSTPLVRVKFMSNLGLIGTGVPVRHAQD